eukprot:COSAG02_NODE_110_length_36062_cov_85.812106_11_plen_71_part_00
MLLSRAELVAVAAAVSSISTAAAALPAAAAHSDDDPAGDQEIVQVRPSVSPSQWYTIGWYSDVQDVRSAS